MQTDVKASCGQGNQEVRVRAHTVRAHVELTACFYKASGTCLVPACSAQPLPVLCGLLVCWVPGSNPLPQTQLLSGHCRWVGILTQLGSVLRRWVSGPPAGVLEKSQTPLLLAAQLPASCPTRASVVRNTFPSAHPASSSSETPRPWYGCPCPSPGCGLSSSLGAPSSLPVSCDGRRAVSAFLVQASEYSGCWVFHREIHFSSAYLLKSIFECG